MTYAGGVGAFKGLPTPFVAGAMGLSHGGSIGFPNALEGNNRAISVGNAATTIYSFQVLSPALGHDSAFVIINGSDDSDGTRNWSDLLHVMPGIGFEKLGNGLDSGGSPARTYSLSGSNLCLAMISGTFSVCCVVSQARNGNKNG